MPSAPPSRRATSIARYLDHVRRTAVELAISNEVVGEEAWD
jgi:hypothetical protein